ncbi:MAG: XRE family transcriptional regulator [Proteobacteria bacterium]|nr:MAG: XRE family transcriptional regulator [Pseudomonadota bacterium]
MSTFSPVHNIVGQFIRSQREKKGLSQKALGQLFSPPVTTQFISNIERGVTPLPPVHVQTLTKIFEIREEEFLTVFEREYVTKLSQQVGRPDAASGASIGKPVFVADSAYDFVKRFAEAYQTADGQIQEQVRRSVEATLSSLR